MYTQPIVGEPAGLSKPVRELAPIPNAYLFGNDWRPLGIRQACKEIPDPLFECFPRGKRLETRTYAVEITMGMLPRRKIAGPAGGGLPRELVGDAAPPLIDVFGQIRRCIVLLTFDDQRQTEAAKSGRQRFSLAQPCIYGAIFAACRRNDGGIATFATKGVTNKLLKSVRFIGKLAGPDPLPLKRSECFPECTRNGHDENVC